MELLRLSFFTQSNNCSLSCVFHSVFYDLLRAASSTQSWNFFVLRFSPNPITPPSHSFPNQRYHSFSSFHFPPTYMLLRRVSFSTRSFNASPSIVDPTFYDKREVGRGGGGNKMTHLARNCIRDDTSSDKSFSNDLTDYPLVLETASCGYNKR